MTTITNKLRLVAISISAVAAFAACSSGAASPSATGNGAPSEAASAVAPSEDASAAAPSGSAETAGWPNTGTLSDGSTFTLKPSIAAKVAAGEPINYVASCATDSTDIFSAQTRAGFEASLPIAQAIYPLNAKRVCPQTAYDTAQQLAQIQALVDSNQLDCLAIHVDGADTFTNITAKLLAAGIPVFTEGAGTNGNELQGFHTDQAEEGVQMANAVLEWAQTSGVPLKGFMMSSGAPESTWAQERMKSFRSTIQAAIPDATFYADETNALNTTFEQPKAYDAFKAFVIGHPDVQVLLSADQSAGTAAKVITDLDLAGKAWSAGWNPSFDQLDAIDAGQQIAVGDQKWSDQAGFGALACATLFGKGEVLPNSNTPVLVTKANTAESREFLKKVLGQ